MFEQTSEQQEGALVQAPGSRAEALRREQCCLVRGLQGDQQQEGEDLRAHTQSLALRDV